MSLEKTLVSPVYQLKISLVDSKPLIWRRVLVRGTIPLNRLHKVFQVVMGWADSHLHQFEIAGKRYGQKDLDEEDMQLRDERRKRLSAFGLQEGDVFIYRYDFGDDWEHEVLVENRLTSEAELKNPVCLGGMNACPPDDSGGVHSYRGMLKALAQPEHESHEDVKQWIGGEWDATKFEAGSVTVRLRRIRA